MVGMTEVEEGGETDGGSGDTSPEPGGEDTGGRVWAGGREVSIVGGTLAGAKAEGAEVAAAV